ncbi:hypothetical protein BSZ35_08145 [Salinibacter sp. 10B]|uniref:DUF4350 domain-containing protein n=1 Tax=Salinibacter sp. 10B TaxID=1923971 RepID=UPI000CF3A225|nr:DUF4350 domain-containing protein [Salinibacter sp. 10B]PQJ34571.1 hypothetical protein BSZ35_08145 [Salinibacter sp. 10B]
MPIRLLSLLLGVLILPGFAVSHSPAAAPSTIDPLPQILFVRGGPGTGGFLEGGSDDQLSSIHDPSTDSGNHGWAALAAELRDLGFALEERREEPVSNGVPTPLPFDQMTLSTYDIIVLGSNNAAYTPAQVDAVESFVRNGGGLLVISDANFGQDWPDAPTSDQAFLDRWGLIMNQDRAAYSISRDEYRAASHPILTGVSAFDGEGVSPVTVGSVPDDVHVRILGSAEAQVRRNDSASGQGTSSAATDDDAALLAGSVGEGRFVVHFDRNTFFNENGAGTDITRLDNRTLARNLFQWLNGDLPLPVELNGYSATYSAGTVTLAWQTLTETNHAGFGIERREGNRDFRPLDFVPSDGDSSSPRSYRYVDAPLPPDVPTLAYRLRIVGTDGSTEYSPIRSITRPEALTPLKPVSPAPVRGSTTIRYVLTRPGSADLWLYDLLGRPMRRLESGHFQAGLREVALPVGRLAPGRYFLRLYLEGATYSQPMTVVR